MPDDPISRLEFARQEVDRVFGQNYAAEHPDVVAAVMVSASLDWAAMTIAKALTEPEHDVRLPGTVVRGLQLPR
jgi:hypothetical protein